MKKLLATVGIASLGLVSACGSGSGKAPTTTLTTTSPRSDARTIMAYTMKTGPINFDNLHNTNVYALADDLMQMICKRRFNGMTFDDLAQSANHEVLLNHYSTAQAEEIGTLYGVAWRACVS